MAWNTRPVGRPETSDPDGQPARVPGPGWQGGLRNATDLALVGIVTALASIPVVTAGAAVATASAAVHHWIEHDQWPGTRPVLRDFGRHLLAGVVATMAALLVAALLVLNLLALSRGVAPGGLPMTILTGALAIGLAGFAGMIVVHIGQQGGHGWRLAVRAAVATVRRRPAVLVASAGVLVLAAVLCGMVLPPLTPIMGGYTLLALHAVHRRLLH